MSDTLRLVERQRPGDMPDDVRAFLAALAGPTAIRIAGTDRRRCRVVVTLLHGNEPSGVRALHAWLRSGARPAVDVLCVLGAVRAALHPPGFAHRMLPGARDLNRCFRPPFAGAEGALAAAILELIRSARPEALIDLHNNTGHNPPYAVTTSVTPACVRLTGLFAQHLVHTDIRLGSLMEATAAFCPTATIECGRAGDAAADETAHAGLQRFLSCDRLDRLPEPALSILERPVRVCLRPGVSVAFDDGPVEGADLTLATDVDRHNFECLPEGTTIGWVATPGAWPLEARGAAGDDRSRELFGAADGVLYTRQALTPIMITTDARIAASDCLFYATWPPDAAGEVLDPVGKRPR